MTFDAPFEDEKLSDFLATRQQFFIPEGVIPVVLRNDPSDRRDFAEW